MHLLAQGRLRLRAQAVYLQADAAAVHRGLESGQVRAKVLLAIER